METIPNKNHLCHKCNKSASILDRNEYLCLNDYLDSIKFRFRKNLRSTCKILRGDTILICISGTNSSMAMMHMLHSRFNLKETDKDQIFFKMKIIYIDDSFILNKSKEEIKIEKEERKQFISKIIGDTYHFDYDILYLEDFIFDNLKLLENKSEEESKEDLLNKVKELFNKNIPFNGGFKNKFLRLIINNIIFQYALKNNYKKVLK